MLLFVTISYLLKLTKLYCWMLFVTFFPPINYTQTNYLRLVDYFKHSDLKLSGNSSAKLPLETP